MKPPPTVVRHDFRDEFEIERAALDREWRSGLRLGLALGVVVGLLGVWVAAILR